MSEEVENQFFDLINTNFNNTKGRIDSIRNNCFENNIFSTILEQQENYKNSHRHFKKKAVHKSSQIQSQKEDIDFNTSDSNDSDSLMQPTLFINQSKQIIKVKVGICFNSQQQVYFKMQKNSEYYTFLTFQGNVHYLNKKPNDYNNRELKYLNPNSPFDIDSDKYDLRIYFIKETDENLKGLKIMRNSNSNNSNNSNEVDYSFINSIKEFDFDFIKANKKDNFPENFYFRTTRKTTTINHGNEEKSAKTQVLIDTYLSDKEELSNELNKGLYLDILIAHDLLEIQNQLNITYKYKILLFNIDNMTWLNEFNKEKSPLVPFFGMFKFFNYFSKWALTNYINDYILKLMFDFSHMSYSMLDMFRKFGVYYENGSNSKNIYESNEVTSNNNSTSNLNKTISNTENPENIEMCNSNKDNNTENANNTSESKYKYEIEINDNNTPNDLNKKINNNRSNTKDSKFSSRTIEEKHNISFDNNNNSSKDSFVVFPLKNMINKGLNLIDINNIVFIKDLITTYRNDVVNSKKRNFTNYEYYQFKNICYYYTPQFYNKTKLCLSEYENFKKYFDTVPLSCNTNSIYNYMTNGKNKRNHINNHNNNDADNNLNPTNQESDFSSTFESVYFTKVNELLFDKHLDENLYFHDLFKHLLQNFSLTDGNSLEYTNDWEELKKQYISKQEFLKDSLVKSLVKQITYKGFLNIDIIMNERMGENNYTGNKKWNGLLNKLKENAFDWILSGLNGAFNLNEGYFHKHFSMLGMSYNFNQKNYVHIFNTEVDESVRNKARIFDIIFMPNWAYDVAEMIMKIWEKKFQLFSEYSNIKSNTKCNSSNYEENSYDNMELKNLLGNSLDLITSEFFDIYSECLPDFNKFCYSFSDFIREEFNNVDNACQHFTNKSLRNLLKNNFSHFTILNNDFNDTVKNDFVPLFNEVLDPYMVHVDSKYKDFLNYWSDKQGYINKDVKNFFNEIIEIKKLKLEKAKLIKEVYNIDDCENNNNNNTIITKKKISTQDFDNLVSNFKNNSEINDYVIIDEEIRKEINNLSCLNDKNNPRADNELTMVVYQLLESNLNKIYWNIVKAKSNDNSYFHNSNYDRFFFIKNNDSNINDTKDTKDNEDCDDDSYSDENETCSEINVNNNRFFPITYLLNLNYFYQFKLNNKLMTTIIESLISKPDIIDDFINNDEILKKERHYFGINENGNSVDYDLSIVKIITTSRLLKFKSVNMCYMYYDYLTKCCLYISNKVSNFLDKDELRNDSNNYNEKEDKMTQEIRRSKENNNQNEEDNDLKEDDIKPRISVHSNLIANPQFSNEYPMKENCYVRIGWLTVNLRYFNKRGLLEDYIRMFE